MKVLLVPSLDIVGGRIRRYVPYGLLSLQAIAADYATEVDILRPSWDDPDRLFLSPGELCDVLLQNVDLTEYCAIGFSTVTSSFYYTIRLIEKVRNSGTDIKVILGGPFVTKLSSNILDKLSGIDAIFVGEAEHSFGIFLERLDRGQVDFTEIPGVATPGRSYCPAVTEDDLDDLPFISRARDYGAWFRHRNPIVDKETPIPLEATRGCPLQCSFCSTRQVWGSRVRRKSPGRIIAEMESLSRLCGGPAFFNLIGDNIGVPRAPFLEFCDELAVRNPGFTWGCSLKLDRLETPHLRQMWNAGMRAMFVGLESGNQETLDRVRKKTDIDKEIGNVRSAIDLGFRITTSFIIGFPWEEYKDVNATLALHRDLLQSGVGKSQVNLLMPIPGTDIVANSNIVFERSWLELLSDGVATPGDMADAAMQHPTLFTHFGRYDTPKINPEHLILLRHESEVYARMLAGIRPASTLDNWNAF